MLAAYVQFRPVLHLWAAMIHGREHGRDDISLDSPKNLPAFIGIAESILKMARTLPSGGADRRFAVKPSEAWSFTLPERFHQSADLVALLLNEEQLRVLNEHKARNRLS